MGDKVYLGDGVYAAWDGDRLVLTAENGMTATDTVVLEPEVLLVLFRFVKRTPLGAMFEVV